jgi:hypothetical protein
LEIPGDSGIPQKVFKMTKKKGKRKPPRPKIDLQAGMPRPEQSAFFDDYHKPKINFAIIK